MLGFLEWALFLGPIQYMIKNVAFWLMFLSIKEYIIWAVIALAIYWLSKGSYYMLNILATILKSRAGQFIMTALVCFCIGFTACFTGCDSPSDPVEVIKVRFVEEGLRSTAIMHNGKAYYSAGLINKYLERKGLVSRFQPRLIAP